MNSKQFSNIFFKLATNFIDTEAKTETEKRFLRMAVMEKIKAIFNEENFKGT